MDTFSCRGYFSKNSQRGFTLIEITIVALIIGIIASIIMFPFLTFRQQTLLNTQTEEVITLINKARLATMSSKGGVQYGVRFEADRVILFQGSVYNPLASTNEVKMIDPALQLSLPTNNGGSTNNILFDFITGSTAQNSTTTLIVTSRPQASSTIIINPSGVVTLGSSLLGANAPVATIFAAPSSVPLGTPATLTWSSGNTTSCTASDGWSGARATAGSEITPNLSVPTTYTLTCVGPYGNVIRSVTVGIDTPVISISASPASVVYGTPSTINWSVLNAAGSCTATDGWSGSKSGVGGSQGTGNLTVATTYTLSCSNVGGTSVESVTVTLVPPTVTISASPTSMSLGATSNITWSSTNATSCTGVTPSGGTWGGGKSLSGTHNTGALTTTTTYTLSCTGPSGTTVQSTTVTVIRPEFVHIATNYVTSTDSITSTFPGSSTSGNLIVVALNYWKAPSSVLSVTDSKGNVYTRAVGPQDWTGNQGWGDRGLAEMWYAKNITGGGVPIVVTATFSGVLNEMEIHSAEYSNLNTVNPLDQVASAEGSGTVADSGTRTTTSPGELIVNYAVVASSYTPIIPSAGFTVRATRRMNFFSDGLAVTAGPYSASSSLSSSDDWVQFMLTFRL